MIPLILIAGILVAVALMSATGGESRPVQPVVSIVEEPAGSNIDLLVTVILLLIVLLSLVLSKTTL